VTRWRWGALAGVLALVGVPVALPLLNLVAAQDRLARAAGNTFLLVAGTVGIALPLGTVAAALLYRTDLPLREAFRFFTILTLFVPLPVLTTAWQSALGNGGLLPLAAWASLSDRPWAEGLGPAVWIHAQAALPWVIVIVGHGLRGVEPELEEDALLAAPPWRVLVSVTLPRGRGAIVAAAVWIALQASTEMAVADVMLVPTFAEGVYAEFWRGGGDSLARAVAVSLPLVAFSTIGVCLVLIRLDRILPPLATAFAEARPLALGRARWPCLAGALLTVGLLAGVPLAALVWKAGQRGYPPAWSAALTVQGVANTLHNDAGLLRNSFVTVLVSALAIATLGLVLCWLMLDAPRLRRGLFVLLVVAWSLPGPIIGIGLMETIRLIVAWVPVPAVAQVLYNGPSAVPVVWAHLVRFLPCAVVALWPVVRLLPPDLRDALRLDGAGPLRQVRELVWPRAWRAWLAMVVATAALALGEVGAVAMRVETPGWETFARRLFDRMHYGQSQDVPSLCLAMLLLVGVGGILVRAVSGLVLRLRARAATPPPRRAPHSAPRLP
jgi:iron(III) transport system permease protein